jgi:hypothetical protein
MQKQYHKKTTLRSKSSTIKGLLYVHNPEKCEKGTLSDQPRLSCITSTALLGLWGRQSLEDMTSLGTDFEMHAIWQGYFEEPAAKDFIVRKSCTIALSKAQGSCHRTSNNQPYSRVWKSLGDSLPERYCITQRGLCHARKWSSKIFVGNKGMIRICPIDVCVRSLWQKVKRGKITGGEATTRFPVAFCFKKPTCPVPGILGRMCNLLAQSAKGMRNRTRNQIHVQPRKARRN